MSTAKEILSLNLAGWHWKLSDENYRERLLRACHLIKRNTWHPFLIALQEVILGDKYIALLQEEFPDYEIITPKSYDASKNRRSAVCCTLLNRRDLISYSHNTLDGVEQGSGRYVYLTVSTDFGNYRILNVHIPQTAAFPVNAPANYIESRKNLKRAFEDAVMRESQTLCNDATYRFILVGDLNATPDSDFVRCLAHTPKHRFVIKEPTVNLLKEEDLNTPTWVNEQLGCSQHLDYVLYSIGAWVAYGLARTEVIDDTIKSKISDHVLLRSRFFPTIAG